MMKIFEIRNMDVIFIDLKLLTHLQRWIHYGHNLDWIVHRWGFRSDASTKSQIYCNCMVTEGFSVWMRWFCNNLFSVDIQPRWTSIRSNVGPTSRLSMDENKQHLCIFHASASRAQSTPFPHGSRTCCPEVGCPFPTGSPFQWLEIPQCTKRPDMIPQHCRQGREQGPVLIRQPLLSGKILKGMRAIVGNCMGTHSIPSAAGMCYWSWIGADVWKFIISAFVVVVVVVLWNTPCATNVASLGEESLTFLYTFTQTVDCLNGGLSCNHMQMWI